MLHARLRSVPWARHAKVVLATLGYALVAASGDLLLGTNYGFLTHKPVHASLLDALSPWPWYIPELVLLGLASMALYSAPFVLMGALTGRGAKRT